MTKAHDTHGARRAANFFPLNDLPNDLLASVFEAVGDLFWVRHTFPLVCKAWSELYRTKNASPLHETLELDFWKEVGSARAEARALQRALRREPLVRALRVISWAKRRAGSVRKLRLEGGSREDLGDFGPRDLGALVAAAATSLSELWIGWGFDKRHNKHFWEAMRDSVAPKGRLRLLVVMGCFAVSASESDVECLAQLAGSIEELVLSTSYLGDPVYFQGGSRLQRFPESICALTELRHLELSGHNEIAAVPAAVLSLKKLKELDLSFGHLASVSKELGELSGLEKLNLGWNANLGNNGALPAELGKVNSLRELYLGFCGLRTVPAFLGELESLERLNLAYNDFQIDATTLDPLIKCCPRLRWVRLEKTGDDGDYILESLAHIKAFKAKLLAKNPDAKVTCE